MGKNLKRTPGKRLESVSAGCFSSWLRRIRVSLIRHGEMNVPCGTCIACCTSSYFIHVTPEDTQALKAIDKRLLFPAPGFPKGHMLMGYDEKGHCPMQKKHQCLIYQSRPKTCRIYDCRVFAATGVPANDQINRQVVRWKFTYPTPKDIALQEAVMKASQFLQENLLAFADRHLNIQPSQLALAAVKVYPLFLEPDFKSRQDALELTRNHLEQFDLRCQG